MKLLLDTHAFLWAVSEETLLSDQARDLIQNNRNDLLLSTASLWEIAIKLSIGKLTLTEPYDVFVPEQLAVLGVVVLPASIQHYALVAGLPHHHRDPFDRLIIAQAIAEKLPIISIDDKFDKYSVQRRW
jgi:PIN domain nuclease of toxin-antitoxin system